jgi:hypothetical protein
MTIRIGPGTELKIALRRCGIRPDLECHCDERALVMDLEGPEWCRNNLDVIVGWLAEEAARKQLAFVRKAAEILVVNAIERAEWKLSLIGAIPCGGCWG